VLKAVGLVPSGGEDIEGDLAADGVGEAQIREFLLEGFDELGADLVFFVVLLVVLAFLVGGVTADWGDIDHAIPIHIRRNSSAHQSQEQFLNLRHPPSRSGYELAATKTCAGGDSNIPEFNKGPPLYRDINLALIAQNKIHKRLVLLLPQPDYEAIPRQHLPQSDCREPVLRKAEIKQGGDICGCRAKLFLLFCQVGATDEADGTFVPQGGEEGEHFGGDALREKVVSERGL